MKVFITGRAGAGKSAVIKELQIRGLTAYNTDDIPGTTRLELKATGEVSDWPIGYVDWQKYSWNWQEKAIKSLVSSDGTVFIGAIVGNWRDFLPIFDLTIVLTVAPDVLKKRRLTRNTHEFAQDKRNVEEAIIKASTPEEFISTGAIPIDSNRPIEQIVDDILKYVNDDSKLA